LKKFFDQLVNNLFNVEFLYVYIMRADVEAPGDEKWGHLKNGGKQWQATPKNLSGMQRTRAIPVVWLKSGSCPDWPKGWIPIIIIIIIIIII